MADLSTLANLDDVLSGAAVVGGAAFAIIQLREYRTQRRENAAAELVRSTAIEARSSPRSVLCGSR